MKKFTLEFKPMGKKESLGMGFRQAWISAENEDIKYDLACGAGMGSPWLIMAVKKDHELTIYACDMRELVKAFIEGDKP